MKRSALVLAVQLLLLAAARAAVNPAEPWQSPYQGDDLAGPGVIACWRFESGAVEQDSSSGRHHGKISGAIPVDQGRFGGALDCGVDPSMSKRRGLLVPDSPDFSPAGAFSVEMWIKPNEQWGQDKRAHLIDNMYASSDGWQWLIQGSDRSGARSFSLNLGFGSEIEHYQSQPRQLQSGRWHHIAATYDGAGGATFFLDGMHIGGSTAEGRKSISPPKKRQLSVGDRAGSNYAAFPGLIDEVRILHGARQYQPLSVHTQSDRRVFIRMEPRPEVRVHVVNHLRTERKGVALKLSLGAAVEQRIEVPPIGPLGEQVVSFAIDTALRPDLYPLGIALEGGESAGALGEALPIRIVARPDPRRMPVILWGLGGTRGVVDEIPRLKRLGFTHCLGLSVDLGEIWNAGKPLTMSVSEDAARMLDEALAHDISIAMHMSPGRWARDKAGDFHRVNPSGKPYAKSDVNPLHPRILQFARNVGETAARTYGSFPAFGAALVESEVRGESQLSFSDLDREAYKKAAGREIPNDLTSKAGLQYAKIPGFPADRVIADDDPVYAYLKWFWTEGDGWNGDYSAVSRGFHATGRPDLWTWHDPAVRVPSIHGSGGATDVISQWTYSYPDPIRIGMPTDELLAMARGAAQPQQVMSMTQIIWYRSQTAPTKPAGKEEAERSVWEDADPDAAFITIAPMHLREMFWTKIARPIQGIMYHGWGSLVEGVRHGGYRHTHPETQNELARLTHEVIQPLGPTLKQLAEPAADVAFLESFASQMFARRGNYGWSHGWQGDVYQILQRAQIQPEIVYEQTIAARGMEGFKAIVMVDCDVLPRSIVQAIQQWQKKGGLIIGDDHLCPALKADYVLKTFTRTKQADVDNQAMIAATAEFRRWLDSRYRRKLDSSDPRVITRLRTSGRGLYCFAVNDHREYGTYVGQYKLVMENGLPARATLRLADPAAALYDLVRHRPMALRSSQGGAQFDLDLGPGEGGVYLAIDQPIAGVSIATEKHVSLGKSCEVTIRVNDARGKAIHAMIPLRVEITDPDGRLAERSGYHAAEAGELKLKLDLAANDLRGLWRIRVVELAGGNETSAYIRVVPVR